MTPLFKRFVLLGVSLMIGGALLLGAALRDPGLPATPAATAAPPVSATSQPPAGGVAQPPPNLPELQQRLAANPRDPDALAQMVDYLFQAKAYAQAADLLSGALDAAAESPRLRVALGRAFFYQGMSGMAQRELRKATEVDPTNAEAQFDYAISLSHGANADLDAARAAWETVVRLDGDGELGRRARQFLEQTSGS